MQTKRQSLMETVSNTSLGLLVAWAINMTCILYISYLWVAGTTATILCTVASLIRGYAVRRYYNRKATC